MKKQLKKVLLVLFLISSVSISEGRTWTNKKGKQAEAKLNSCKDGIVQLELPNGKIFEMKKDELVVQDQLFIDEALKKTSAEKTSEVNSAPKETIGRSSAPQNYKPSTIDEIPQKKKLKNWFFGNYNAGIIQFERSAG